jgi:hypothetical protein
MRSINSNTGIIDLILGVQDSCPWFVLYLTGMAFCQPGFIIDRMAGVGVEINFANVSADHGMWAPGIFGHNDRNGRRKQT